MLFLSQKCFVMKFGMCIEKSGMCCWELLLNILISKVDDDDDDDASPDLLPPPLSTGRKKNIKI